MHNAENYSALKAFRAPPFCRISWRPSKVLWRYELIIKNHDLWKFYSNEWRRITSFWLCSTQAIDGWALHWYVLRNRCDQCQDKSLTFCFVLGCARINLLLISHNDGVHRIWNFRKLINFVRAAQDYLGAVILFAAIVTALLAAKIYSDATSPSLVALAINYTLLVPIYLNWVVKLSSDLESYIGAVERISHYSDGAADERQPEQKCKSAEWWK